MGCATTAVLFGPKIVLNVLSRGINHYNGRQYKSIHAEKSAIDKLPKTKKKISINILIIRVNSSGKVVNSKPCDQCMKYMKSILPKRNYILKNVYWSNDDGTITIMKNIRTI